VRRVPFSCVVRPDSFSAVPRATGPVFMSCAPGLVFGGIEGVGSRFYVLRTRTHFRRCGGHRVTFSCFARRTRFQVLCSRNHFPRYRGRRVPFSSFALPNSISEGPRASGPVFKFCAPEFIFGFTEGVGSRFHVLRARTRFL
jgi:hypothetical protein